MGYFDINGRAARTEFAVCTLVNWVFVSLISHFLYSSATPQQLGKFMVSILLPFAVMALFQGPVTFRRLNDLKKRKREILFLFLPVYNIYFLLVLFTAPSNIAITAESSSPPPIAEKVLTCPACNSDNCTYDKVQSRLTTILMKVFLNSKPVDIDCRCFECGNRWTIK
jgi:uncharacterized membrane protein YhaH (DUF805 family)